MFTQPSDVSLPAWASFSPSPPPLGDGDPQQGLHVTVLRSRCATSWQRKPPWGDLNARLAHKAMWEGREVGGDRVRGIGMPGVDVHPTGLHVLASSEGAGRTPQRLQGVGRSVSPANRPRASLWGGSWLVAIYIYRGPGGCLCGACVHGTFPVRSSGGGWTISGASGAPHETLSWGVRSWGCHRLDAWAAWCITGNLHGPSQAHTQLLPKQISIMCTQTHSCFKLYPITSPSTHPSNPPYKSPIIITSTRPTRTPSHTWDITCCFRWPHRSHYTRIQEWTPLPGPVLDAVLYPVVHRG